VENVRELTRKIKIGIPIRYDEPMAKHTSFHIGGSADAYAAPRSVEEIKELHSFCRQSGLPCFLLGGGTNLLVSDRGIRGMVVDISGVRGVGREGEEIAALAGSTMEETAGFALFEGLSGLEFTAGLPGSVGGAVWMNARAYEKSISDVLVRTEVLQADGTVRIIRTDPGEWGYKRSPFQNADALILCAFFSLQHGDRERMEEEMRRLRADRETKGHFLHPCAGSVFKNNRDFGAPTGKLIDSLGLKGRRIGDAAIASFHGNIIVNLGKATAADVLSLILLIESEVKQKLGFTLEREVLLAGEW
jgi:UDP-N-acetylmuramate dehydrogenase